MSSCKVEEYTLAAATPTAGSTCERAAPPVIRLASKSAGPFHSRFFTPSISSHTESISARLPSVAMTSAPTVWSYWPECCNWMFLIVVRIASSMDCTGRTVELRAGTRARAGSAVDFSFMFSSRFLGPSRVVNKRCPRIRPCSRSALSRRCCSGTRTAVSARTVPAN